jgi:hypothetical protein
MQPSLRVHDRERIQHQGRTINVQCRDNSRQRQRGIAREILRPEIPDLFSGRREDRKDRAGRVVEAAIARATANIAATPEALSIAPL